MVKQNKYLNFQDMVYFYKAIKDVKKMKQDTVFHEKLHVKHNKYRDKRDICNQNAHIQFFNSNVQCKVISKNPVSYIRESYLKNELNKLKNNFYNPEICVDLHGLNQYQAQQELGKLICICHRKHIFCFGVIHGHGKNILKTYIPIWLSKHPDVLVFYQLPKTFGRNTTISVLIDYNNNYSK